MDMENEESSTLKRRRLNSYPGGGIGDDMIPVDRISNLPESIISHILSSLPTKSAVATSFLSKSWRFRWTKVTACDFSDRLWPNCVRSEPETRGAAVPAMNFVEFVNLVFANHTGSIHKLRLRWQSRNLRSVYLNIWLNAAIARNFRVLDLATVAEPSDGEMRDRDENYMNYEFDLPAELYTSATLEVLKLRGPFRIKLPFLVRLPKLTVLELICVNFECDESVEKLISACSVLESLKIKRYHSHADLLVCKISSPSLRRLHFYHYCSSNHLKFVIDTPALEHLVIYSDVFSEITCVQQVMPVKKLEISAVCESDHPRGDGVAGIIQACDGVKAMTLWEPAMLALDRGTTPLPATFVILTKLVVEFSRSNWSYMLDLIDRCNNLQVLDITVCDMSFVDEAEMLLESFGGSYWRHPIRVPGCLSSSLKHVYFNFFNGLEDEMAMLKFLLNHGLLIERVTLRLDSDYFHLCDTQKLKIVNEVSMLSRASTACKISFSRDAYSDECSGREEW